MPVSIEEICHFSAWKGKVVLSADCSGERLYPHSTGGKGKVETRFPLPHLLTLILHRECGRAWMNAGKALRLLSAGLVSLYTISSLAVAQVLPGSCSSVWVLRSQGSGVLSRGQSGNPYIPLCSAGLTMHKKVNFGQVGLLSRSRDILKQALPRP